MKKYFIHDENGQSGPFDLNELKHKNISRKTPVWFEGLVGWTNAENLEELNPLFQTATPPPFEEKKTPPPPFQNKNKPADPNPNSNETKQKSRTGLIIGAIIFCCLIVGALMIINNPNSVPGIKLQINTPKPVVVTSRADGKGSGLFNARTTVYATVLNEGGAGNVLVNFHVYQGNKEFTRSKSLYLSSSQSQDIEETFEEVDYLSGRITYNVATDIQ